MHEILHNLESKKQIELDNLFEEAFNYKLDLDEVKGLVKLGQKHRERLDDLIQQKSYANVVCEYQMRIGTFLADVDLVTKESQNFIDSQFQVKPELSSKIIRFNLIDIETQLKEIVNDSVNFAKDKQAKVLKKVKLDKPQVILKDPSKYDYKKSISAIHQEKVTCIEMLQNGNFVTGSLDSSIALWDVNKGQILKKFEGHMNQVSKILELNNGNIASASLDKSINVWDRHSAEILYTLEGFDSKVTQILELNADSLIVLSEEDKDFAVWSYKTESKQNYNYYSEHTEKINHVIVVQSKFIYTASSDKTVKRWILKKEKAQHTFNGHQDVVLKLANIEDLMLASASGDKSVKIWEVTMKKGCIHTLEGHESAVTELLYDQKIKMLATGSLDRTIRIWNRQASFECVQTLRIGGQVSYMKFLGLYQQPENDFKIMVSSANENSKDPLGLAQSSNH